LWRCHPIRLTTRAAGADGDADARPVAPLFFFLVLHLSCFYPLGDSSQQVEQDMDESREIYKH
jgi:hypothetical protein